MEKVVFLHYVAGTKCMVVDEEKIKAIKEFLMPKSITEVRSFHDLASFCGHFIKGFSILATPLTKNMKKKMLVFVRALYMHLILLNIGCVLHLC